MNRNEEQPKSGINSKVNNLDSSTYIYIKYIYIYTLYIYTYVCVRKPSKYTSKL